MLSARCTAGPSNKAEMAKYKAKVASGRKKADEKVTKWKWQNARDGLDPLLAWQKMREAGRIDEVYDDVRGRRGLGP